MVPFQCHKKHQCPVCGYSRSCHVCLVSHVRHFPDSWIGMRCNTANQTRSVIFLLKGNGCYDGILKQKLWTTKQKMCMTDM
jgi:hypothetical protein